jgi:hypothetical protein
MIHRVTRGVQRHTNDHDVEVEPLADTLAVPLVGKVGKTNVASQLSANDVSHVAGGLGGGLWVFGRHGLGYRACSTCHWVAPLDFGRGSLAIRHRWACRSWRRSGRGSTVGGCMRGHVLADGLGYGDIALAARRRRSDQFHRIDTSDYAHRHV